MTVTERFNIIFLAVTIPLNTTRKLQSTRITDTKSITQNLWFDIKQGQSNTPLKKKLTTCYRSYLNVVSNNINTTGIHPNFDSS